MAKNKETAAAETEAAKRDVFRMEDSAVIEFGTDAEGKSYSEENSPKKGDSTKALWGKYRSGMTVKDALDAGLTRSNIRRDRRAGFIAITNPVKAEEPAAGADAEASSE